MESDRVHARAVVMRAAVNREDAPTAERGWLDWLRDCGVPAISGVDTRALVRHIRTAGAMRGGLFPAERAAGDRARRGAGRAVDARAGPGARGHAGAPSPATASSNDGPLIAAIDTGIKLSIVRSLVERGARLELHPCTVTPEELLASSPDAVFLANGPGDPAALDYVVDTVRAVIGKQPDVRHLPRPPAAVPGRRPGDVQAPVRPPRRQPPGQGPAHRPDRDHLAEPRLRGRRARRRPARRARRAGALGDRRRRRRALAREPLRPHGRGPHAARRPRRARCSTTRRPGRAPTTRCTSSTASSTR